MVEWKSHRVLQGDRNFHQGQGIDSEILGEARIGPRVFELSLQLPIDVSLEDAMDNRRQIPRIARLPKNAGRGDGRRRKPFQRFRQFRLLRRRGIQGQGG